MRKNRFCESVNHCLKKQSVNRLFSDGKTAGIRNAGSKEKLAVFYRKSALFRRKIRTDRKEMIDNSALYGIL